MAGNRYLLDTNAIIALQKKDFSILALLEITSEVFVPSIVIGELFYGAYKSNRSEENQKTVQDFAAGRVILAPDTNTANMYGQVKYALRIKGRPIPDNDIWIAALAIQYNLILLTKDQHFTEIANLPVRDW